MGLWGPVPPLTGLCGYHAALGVSVGWVMPRLPPGLALGHAQAV